MSEEVKVVESSGNVFLDIGFSEEEAEYHQLRVDLAFAIHHLFEEQKLTPAKTETRFGLDRSDVSRLKKIDITDFTVERLLMILKRLNRKRLKFILSLRMERTGSSEFLLRRHVRLLWGERR